jgi:hypothetical protein
MGSRSFMPVEAIMSADLNNELNQILNDCEVNIAVPLAEVDDAKHIQLMILVFHHLTANHLL